MLIDEVEINSLTGSIPVCHGTSIAKDRQPSPGGPSCGRFYGPRWYVFEAEHKKLLSADTELKYRGFETEIPTDLVRVKPTINGKRSTVYVMAQRPMFFQFGFVLLDLAIDNWSKVRNAPGVKAVLSNAAGRPQPVEVGLIERLRDEAPDRLKLPPTGMQPRVIHEMVLIGRGPFTGHTGVVQGCDGITTVVRLVLFGGYTDVRMRRVDIQDE